MLNCIITFKIYLDEFIFKNRDRLTKRKYSCYINIIRSVHHCLFLRSSGIGNKYPSKYTTSQQRLYNVVTLQRRCNDVVATLCVCWAVVTGLYRSGRLSAIFNKADNFCVFSYYSSRLVS